MKLKKGDHLTAIGIFPDNWEEVKVNDVTTSHKQGFYTTERYVDQGTYLVRITDLLNPRISFEKMPRLIISKRDFDLYRIRRDDFLIARSGSIGRYGIVYEDIDAIFGSFIIRFTFDTQKMINEFFGYLYETELIWKQLLSITQGSSNININANNIMAITIHLPPLPEQRTITTAMSDVDALLASLDRLIAKKRMIKQGTMQQLLTGKTRLSEFTNKPGYKQTEVGVIPIDWDVKRLGELFEITSSKRVYQNEWKTEGIPFYRARELAVLGEKGYVNNELFISKEMYDDFKNIYGVPKVGDMLVTGVGTLGKVYVVPDDREFYFKDGNIIWFRISSKVRSDFLKQLFLTQLINKQIEDASAGTTVGTYTISTAKKTIVPLPPILEQRSIATILSDMDAEITAIEQRHDKTLLLKQGMMQELLTGKTRLI